MMVTIKYCCSIRVSIYLSIIVHFFLGYSGYSQDVSFPKIGQQIEHFAFKKLEGHNDEISSSNLKGRHIILDFWSTGCGACIASFPKMNALQKRFKDSVLLILVGLEEEKRDIKKLYSLLSKKNDLSLISVYDSLYWNKFVPAGVPHLIWIDTAGVIRAITNNLEATEENIGKFIHNKSFAFNDASFEGRKIKKVEVDYAKPLLTDDDQECLDFFFRSVLYKWKIGSGENMYSDIDDFLRSYSSNRYQVTRANLSLLYKLAYFGTIDNIRGGFNSKLILRCSDTSAFVYSQSGDGVGLYNYSIEIPKSIANSARLMSIMKNDLDSYFNVNSRIVKEYVPCYFLRISDPKLVKITVDSTSSLKDTWALESRTADLRNYPIDHLSYIIGQYLNDGLIIYNQTNLEGNIDIQFIGDLDNLDSIRTGLIKFGFDLIPGKQLLETILIEDNINFTLK